MKRRTFIKGMLLSSPSLLLLRSLSLSVVARETELPGKETGPFFIFIGDYGRKVMAHFQRLLFSQPIRRTCRWLQPDINLVTKFIQGPIDPIKVALASPPMIQSPLILFVFDANKILDRRTAEMFAKTFKGSDRTLTIANIHFPPHHLYKGPFDLAFSVPGSGEMFIEQANFLHAIHSTFCGCSGIGNLVCQKLYFQDLREAGLRFGTAKTLSYRFNGDSILPLINRINMDLALFLDENNCTDCYYFIMEMPINEPEPIERADLLVDTLLPSDSETMLLPHPSLSHNEYRITVLKMETARFQHGDFV